LAPSGGSIRGLATLSHPGVSAVDTAEKQRRAIRAQADDIEDQLNQRGVGPPTGPRKLLKPRPVGTSRAAILRRLRRDHVELYRLVLDGSITPFAAACAAGFRKRPGRQPKPGPTDSFNLAPSAAEELWLGCSADGSVFQDEDERRAAWVKHRAKLMELWGSHGRRPVAWWAYESPDDLDFPGPELERSTLFEAGLLTEPEQAELVAYWKYEFARACHPGFFVCLGQGHFLEGEQARQAHYRWADIPAALVEAWTGQHKKEKPRSEATAGLESA
jgi:hypothetical protein